MWTKWSIKTFIIRLIMCCAIWTLQLLFSLCFINLIESLFLVLYKRLLNLLKMIFNLIICDKSHLFSMSGCKLLLYTVELPQWMECNEIPQHLYKNIERYLSLIFIQGKTYKDILYLQISCVLKYNWRLKWPKLSIRPNKVEGLKKDHWSVVTSKMVMFFFNK